MQNAIHFGVFGGSEEKYEELRQCGGSLITCIWEEELERNCRDRREKKKMESGNEKERMRKKE